MSDLLLWLRQFVLSDSFLLMVIMFAVIGVAEFIWPARPVPARHYVFNSTYAVTAAFLEALLAPPINTTIAYLIQSVGFGLIDLRVVGLDGFAGAFVAMLIAAFIFDFLFYWFHRLEHVNKILWQQHLLHHCDEYMNVTSAARSHLLAIVLIPTFITIPMAILFKMPPISIGVMSLIPFAWTYLIHANIRLGFGPFWWLLVSPDFHRIHHSLEKQHIDKNFADWFPILDIVFGTAWRPRPGENPESGVAGVHVSTLREAYLQPFIEWKRMFAGDSARHAVPAAAAPGKKRKRQAGGRRRTTR